MTGQEMFYWEVTTKLNLGSIWNFVKQPEGRNALLAEGTTKAWGHAASHVEWLHIV